MLRFRVGVRWNIYSMPISKFVIPFLVRRRIGRYELTLQTGHNMKA